MILICAYGMAATFVIARVLIQDRLPIDHMTTSGSRLLATRPKRLVRLSKPFTLKSRCMDDRIQAHILHVV